MQAVRYPLRCLAIMLFGFATQAHANYALTGIYDFRSLVTDHPELYSQEQRDYPALVYEFEGLTFTQDGSLWASIAADPFGSSRELWQLDLAHLSVSSFPHPGTVSTIFGPLPLSLYGNPVGLASIGDQLIVGHNGHSEGNLIGAVDPATQTWSEMFMLDVATCNEVEGLAYAGGHLYASCQNDNTVLEFDPANTGAVARSFTFADQVLGLAETDDGRLLVGAYPSRELILFDPAGVLPSETISLDGLFGPGRDYYALTGEEYSVQVVPSEGFRTLPDPDGLAYSNGKIYMSFDGDLRIFEISAVPEPETWAMLLAGLVLVGWKIRRIRT